MGLTLFVDVHIDRQFGLRAAIFRHISAGMRRGVTCVYWVSMLTIAPLALPRPDTGLHIRSLNPAA